MRRTIPMSFVMIDISGRLVKIHQLKIPATWGHFESDYPNPIPIISQVCYDVRS